MEGLMQLLNAMGLRSDTLGNQIGDRLANDEDPYAMHRMRNDPRFSQNQEMQNYLAPKEHQQFMREMTGQNPMMGALGAGATGPYSMAKMAAPGLTSAMAGEGRMPGAPLPSRPSMEEIMRALRGFGQGFRR